MDDLKKKQNVSEFMSEFASECVRDIHVHRRPSVLKKCMRVYTKLVNFSED